jgi:hypothetical protein
MFIDPVIVAVLTVVFIGHMAGSMVVYRRNIEHYLTRWFNPTLLPGEAEAQKRAEIVAMLYESPTAKLRALESEWWARATYLRRQGAVPMSSTTCSLCGAEPGERCDAGLHS